MFNINKFLLSVLIFLSYSGLTSFSQSIDKKTAIDKNMPAVEKVKWLSIDEVQKLVKKKPKKVFLDVYTDWCGWCKKYDNVTFANPVIANYLNQHFYSVKFNAESKNDIVFKGKTYIHKNPDGKRQPHDLAIHFLNGRLSYPTVVFLNEDMDVITPVPGFMGPKDFEGVVNFFGSDAYKNMQYEEFKSKFKGKIAE